MADFSYDTAIAPMKSNFFADVAAAKGLTSGAARYLTSKYTEEVSPFLEAQLKTQGDMLKSQYQQLAFKRQQLDLMTAADEAKAQREAMETLPTDIQNLTGIVNDPNKDNFEKLTAVNQYKMQNAGRFSRNQNLINLVSSAEQTLKTKDESEKQKTALGYALASQGLPEAVKSVFGGEVTEGVGKQYFDAASAIGQERLASAKSVAASKENAALRTQQEQRRTQQYGAQLDFYKTRLDELNRLATKKGEEGYDVGTLKEVGSTAPVSKRNVPQAEPFKFAPQDKAQIEETVRLLYPAIGDAELSKYSDEDLYRTAYRLASGGVSNLLGIESPTSSNISSKFE
jgi:type II secretory pathway pseudopilin PulG